MKVLKRMAAACIAAVVVGLSACSSGAPAAPGPRVTQPEGAHELTKADVDAWLDGKIPRLIHRIPKMIPVIALTVVWNDGYGRR